MFSADQHLFLEHKQWPDPLPLWKMKPDNFKLSDDMESCFTFSSSLSYMESSKMFNLTIFCVCNSKWQVHFNQ